MSIALGTAMLEHAAPTMTASNADRDVVSQIKLAFANPLPLVIGALIGALVPIATYTVGHAELDAAGWISLPGAIVIGGCCFSAITVYKWGRRAFDSALKAVGFVILSEGVMSFSHVAWLSLVVLGFLVAINAVANGANLAIAHLDAERRRVEAEVTVTAFLPVLLTPPGILHRGHPGILNCCHPRPGDTRPEEGHTQARGRCQGDQDVSHQGTLVGEPVAAELGRTAADPPHRHPDLWNTPARNIRWRARAKRV
jgi:hypothetical protein